MNGSKAKNARNTSITIFVVDAEPMLLEMAVMILEPLHYRVRTFRDPHTALAEFSAAKPRPALVVTDYAMHTMSGMDLIRPIRSVILSPWFNPSQRSEPGRAFAGQFKVLAGGNKLL